MLIAAFALAFGCNGSENPKSPRNDSLFRQLGEIEGLRPIVDEFVWRLATDELIGKSLVGTDVPKFKEDVFLFLCVLAEGPCLDPQSRPLIRFRGSPSAAGRRVAELARKSALAAGVKPSPVNRLVRALEREIREFIGPPR